MKQNYSAYRAYAHRRVSTVSAMKWPAGTPTTETFIDGGYCLDAPDALPIGGANIPAYGAGLTLRERAFV